MGKKTGEKVALLFRTVLYISISAMIAGKIIHRMSHPLGALTVNAGVYLIILCPLIGLVTVMLDSFRFKNRKLFLLSLTVALLILVLMTGIIISSRF